MLGAVDVFRRAGCVLRVGHEQRQAASGHVLHAENLHIARAGRHRAVEVVPHAIALVHVEEGDGAALEQIDLVRLAVLLEPGGGVVQRPLALVKGQVRCDDRFHFPADGLAVGLRRIAPRQVDGYAAADAVLNADALARPQPPDGQQRHKAQAALIDAAAFLIRQRQGDQRAVMQHRVAHLQHAASLPHRQHTLRGRAQCKEALQDPLACRHLDGFAAVGDLHTMPPVCSVVMHLPR